MTLHDLPYFFAHCLWRGGASGPFGVCGTSREGTQKSQAGLLRCVPWCMLEGLNLFRHGLVPRLRDEAPKPITALLQWTVLDGVPRSCRTRAVGWLDL